MAVDAGDLDALRGSDRGKIVVLCAVLVAALGAAAWFIFFDQEGIGTPERADKVLVVRTPRSRGFSAVLGEDGFDAAEGELQDWVAKAHKELDEVPEGTDVEVVMRLADRFGYGYVVFEEPQSVDFSGVEIDEIPDMPEHVRFAVLSAGDFAFPHRMTVNPEPSAVLRRVDISLLQALFAQEVLAESLPDNAGASVSAIQLRSKLKEALAGLELIDTAEGLADKIRGQVAAALDDERGRAKPVVLASVDESGTATALANGGVLTSTRQFSIVSDDGIRADLEPAREESLWFSAAASADDRVACSALLGGSISTAESPRFRFSEDGGGLLLDTQTHGPQLWTLDGAAEQPCSWVRRGSVPPSQLDDVQRTMVHADGLVARVGTSLDAVSIEVVRPGTDTPASLIRLPSLTLRDVAWLQTDVLAATGDDDVLYLISTAPDAPIVAIAPPGLGRNTSLHEVARLSTRSLVLTVGSDPRRLVRLDANADWSTLFVAPAVEPGVEAEAEDEDEAEAEDGALDEDVLTPVWADVAALRTTVLTREGWVSQPTASADGATVAFTLQDPALDDPGRGDDSEIAVVSASGGPLQMLTRNVLRDRAPALTADGRWVLFQTRVELPRSNWRISVPRAVPVPSRSAQKK
ncbi:MAG: hypothetical protein AAGA54_06030 [Myxococcota bacterium]